MNKFIVLHHISRSINSSGIRRNGLLKGQRPSGYGPKPKLNAVYMFHPKNTQVLFDFIDRGEDFDLWEVRIPEHSPLVDKMVADEDAVKYQGVEPTDWENSIEKFGTCAVLDNIPASMVSLVFRTDFNRMYKKLPEKLIK